MYKVTIGLEVHCELDSNSKVFSPSINGYTEAPNSHVAYQDLGFPGILPIANKEAWKRALIVSMAMNCTTQTLCYLIEKTITIQIYQKDIK